MLMKRGTNRNALDAQRYDIVTIAAVADDVPMLKVALEGGASAKNVTSPYDGAALIAAARLGHDEVVKVLIAAGAPLGHMNSLRSTAVSRSEVIGDNGKRHMETLHALVAAERIPTSPTARHDPARARARARLREIMKVLGRPARNSRRKEHALRLPPDLPPLPRLAYREPPDDDGSRRTRTKRRTTTRGAAPDEEVRPDFPSSNPPRRMQRIRSDGSSS